MNIDNNDFYSLSTLLSSPKDRDHVVAFDRGKYIRWSQFLFDIAQLRDRLRQHNAHHIALCSNNSYLFAVGFFAVCHANKSWFYRETINSGFSRTQPLFRTSAV